MSLFVPLLLSLCLPARISGFADHLVSSGSGCMVDLSTDEVIMNNQVVAYEESTHPELYLAVEMEEGTLVKGPIDVSHSSMSAFRIKLIDPSNDRQVQHAEYAIETTPGAHFVHGGCDDQKRASSHIHNDPGVQLVIDDRSQGVIKVWAGWATGHEAVQLTEELVFLGGETQDEGAGSASETTDSEDPLEEEVIELEEEVEHLESDGDEAHDKGIDAENAELLKAERLALKDLSVVKDLQQKVKSVTRHRLKEAHLDAKDKIKEAALNRRRDYVKDKKKLLDVANGNWKDKLKGIAPMLDNVPKDLLDDRAKDLSNKRGKFLDRHEKRKAHHARRHGDQGATDGSDEGENEVAEPEKLTRLRAFQEKYDHDHYGEAGEFSHTHYGYGMVVLIVLSVCLVQLCRRSGSKADKGRREL